MRAVEAQAHRLIIVAKSSPVKKKTTRRAATAHEKAVLKAAKSRGLIKIDLRKGLTKYARAQVAKFEAVYDQTASVVKLDAKGKKRYKGSLTIKNGYAIVPKEKVLEPARYDKKSGFVIVSGKRLTPAKIKFPDLRKGQRYAVPFATPRGIQYKRFSGPGAGSEMAAFMAPYEDSYPEWEDNVTVEAI